MLSGTGSIGQSTTASVTSTLMTPSQSVTTPARVSLSALLEKAEPQGEVITVGAASPPVPLKLAQRIWDFKFVGMEEFLLAKLGAKSSMLEVLSNTITSKKSKRIESIKQWVCCFNVYTAVMALRHPEAVVDLLAYSSLIVNASRSYEDTPWLIITLDAPRLLIARWGDHSRRSTPPFGLCTLAGQPRRSL